MFVQLATLNSNQTVMKKSYLKTTSMTFQRKLDRIQLVQNLTHTKTVKHK